MTESLKSRKLCYIIIQILSNEVRIITRQWSKDMTFTVQERKFPLGIMPRDRQEECIIDAKLGELNDLCASCRFAGISHFSRQAYELGIQGYVSNVGGDKVTHESLKPSQKNPKKGVDLRVPHTIILERGERYVCHNRDADKKSIYILGTFTPACQFHMPKPALKK